ncbi:putative RNA-directed DNA polymerase, eukaryota, reverse transcriptase zinc-binding domain protein [Tanacetum coccineum]
MNHNESFTRCWCATDSNESRANHARWFAPKPRKHRTNGTTPICVQARRNGQLPLSKQWVSQQAAAAVAAIGAAKIQATLINLDWEATVHANVARFERNVATKSSHAGVKVVNSILNKDHLHSSSNKTSSYVNAAKASLVEGKSCPITVVDEERNDSSVLELNQANLNEFPLAILGCYKDFRSIANACILCQSEGFLEVDVKYLRGLWVLFDTSLETRNKFLKHEGILTWFSSLKPWYDDFVVEERLVWLEIEGVPMRARKTIILIQFVKINYAIKIQELCSWIPTFVGDDSDGDGASSLRSQNLEEEKVENDVELVAGSFDDIDDLAKVNDVMAHEQVPDQALEQEQVIVDELQDSTNKGLHDIMGSNKEPIGSDPFRLDPLLNLKRNKGDSCKPFGFSMIERLEETIKVGMALGLNMEGCETTLASLVAGHGESIVNFLALHETKMLQVDLWMLRQVWGNSYFNFASTSARGMSGGDFNEVREARERFGSIFNERQAEFFNDFIRNASLIDILLGGFNYTWTDKWGSKMSKLDQFLVSERCCEAFPHITGVVLEKGILDHCPILLKEYVVDYGPIPFRFFHSWLEMEGFHDLVVYTWKKDGIVETNGLISFKKKLQNLKYVIREWITSRKGEANNLKKEHQMRFSSIDTKINQGCACEKDLLNRKESILFLGDLDRLEAKDIAQKAKIKWAIEGDENSKFFHGTLKKNRRQLAVRGILKNGEWIEDPEDVKSEFLDHFRSRFQQPAGISPSFNADSFNRLDSHESEFLELQFSRDEIKRVVWDYGGDRAPGPDGFTFKIFITFWDILEVDIFALLSL